MDETRIDAAPTPAHVFAYRAFRSLIVRSPESSPVQPRGHDYEQEHNKENTRTSPTRPSRFSTSPVKAKRKDGEINAPRLEDDLRLTPKKQKTVPVSPTKSILKNPHAPTPRRVGLRDVTVTFKDVRKSVSPEMTRKGSPQRVRSQPSMRTLLEDIALQKPLANVEISAKPTPRSSALVTSSTTAVQDPEFDLDAYNAQTEKEMRRLIKYGQKWKEQARRQDEEIVKLRSSLEEARKENEALQRRIAQTQQPREAKDTMMSSATTVTEDHRLRQKKKDSSNAREDCFVESRSQQEATKETQRPRTGQRSSLREKLDELQELQPSPPCVPKVCPTPLNGEPSRQPSLRKKLSLLQPATAEEKESIPLDEEQARKKKKDLEYFTNLAPNEQGHDQEVQKRSLPVRTASQSVVEDRKAAARERLRVKREARTASSQAALSVVPGQKKGPESSRLETDESQVDWLAMA